jgi:autotransporter-associated beta strand protein
LSSRFAAIGAGTTATVDTGTNFLSFAGALSGSGGFTKLGSGYLAFAGNNSALAGSVTVGGGILNIQSATALGGTAAGTTVANNATVRQVLHVPAPSGWGDAPGGITVTSWCTGCERATGAPGTFQVVNVKDVVSRQALRPIGVRATISQ